MENEEEVENTVKQLCAQASAKRHRREFKNVLMRLKKFLREHTDVLRSMSDETFEALRQVLH
jgi:hypothetical protein